MSGLMGSGGGGLIVKRLSQDAVFRIEVSLSSRKSSAIVMRTTARLYSLQGTASGGGVSGDAEWKSVAYGAPCIQLMRQTIEHNSPFHIKIVIAEVESGISLWEEILGNNSGYQAMQNNFHTFSAKNSTFAIQFASEEEAVRMLESLQDLFLQKEKAETVSFEKKLSDEALFKKPKSFRRLSKKDISAPCNFKHVSGITLQRTQACEEELRGTIQRKMRSLSLSSLTGRKIKPRTKLPGNMTDGSIYVEDQLAGQESPELQQRGEGPGQKGEGGKKGSVLQKFNSLRLMKRRSPKQMRKDDSREQQYFTRDDKRMSLPSHFRHQTRTPLNDHIFSNPQPHPSTREHRSPDRQLSLSSGDLVDIPSSTPPPQQAATLDRRHTMIDYGSRRGPQYNYTPYTATQTTTNTRVAPPTSQQQQPHPLSNRQYMSDMSLNKDSYSRMPMGNGHIVRGVQGVPGDRVAQSLHARNLPKRRSFNEAQLQGKIHWEQGVSTDRQPHMANGRVVQAQPGMGPHAQPGMGPHGQHGSRIPPSSSAGSIPEKAGTKLHPGVMAMSMDSVRMLHDNATPPDSHGMHNHVGGMHTSAGDVRVPPSPTKAAPPTSYPGNSTTSSSPTHYATTSMAMRRTVSASNATQQSRRHTASYIQNGKPREFLPGSMAQYDLLTPRNRPLPPTPIDHMQVSPKRQQQPHKYQSPPHIPQVGLQSHTQNPRQQSQGRIPISKMQMPVTRFQSQTPGAYHQYQTRPQMAQGQVPQRQPISQRLPQGYAPPYTRPPVSYPQAGPSRVAHTQVSPSHVKTQVSPTQAQTQFPVTQPFQPVPAQVPVPTHSSGAQQNPSSLKTSPSKKSATAVPSSGKPANRPPMENYDILLPKEVQSIKDTPGNRDSTTSSTSEELQQYTDQMSRALEQFDSLLAPPPKRHIMQTSL